MSTADKFHVNRSLALCVAGSLMYPTLVNAVGTGETPLTLFGMAVPVFSYADSVFPVIFGVIGLAYVYRAIDRFIPDLFKLVVVPALSLAIVIPVNLLCWHPSVLGAASVLQTVLSGCSRLWGLSPVSCSASLCH